MNLIESLDVEEGGCSKLFELIIKSYSYSMSMKHPMPKLPLPLQQNFLSANGIFESMAILKSCPCTVRIKKK